MTPTGLAVIGAGAWGSNLVRTAAGLDNACLLWVCDARAQTLSAVQKAFPAQKTTHDAAVVFGDPGVQAVIIATNAATHFEIAMKALDAGKDVFVEKPLALAANEAALLLDTARSRGRIAMVGHLMLYHPAVQMLRKLIENGDLGDVLYIYAHRLNLGVVRQEENAWWSLAPHDIAMVNYLLDAMPTSVSAQGGVFLQKERNIEDVVFATLNYPNDRLAHIHVSWLDPHKTRRLTVVGTKKMAIFDDTSSDQKLVLCDKGVEPPPRTIDYAQGVRVRTGDMVIPAVRMTEPLRVELAAFVDAIQTRQAPLASFVSGAQVVSVLEAGSKSLKDQGRLCAIDQVR